MFGISVYGMGAAKVGSLGPVIGWPMFNAAFIITPNVLGVLTGEWRGAGRRPLRLIALGVVVLVLAVFIIGYGSTLNADASLSVTV